MSHDDIAGELGESRTETTEEDTDTGLSRRSILKRGGGVAAALSTAGVGSASSLSHNAAVSVTVHPLTDRVTNADEAYLENVQQAIDYFLSDVSDRLGWFFSYEVDVADDPLDEQYLDSYEIDDCPDGLDNNIGVYDEIEEDPSKEADVHVVVTEQSPFAGVDGNEEYSEVWTDKPAVPWVGVDNGGPYGTFIDRTERYKNAAIQEMVHVLVDPNETDLVSDIGTQEHELGKINDEGESTPCLTFYQTDDANDCNPNDLTNKGPDRCRTDNEWRYSFTRDATDCTLDAVMETYLAHYTVLR